MNRHDCEQFRDHLLQVEGDPRMVIPDELALHLDDCDACRRRFDSTRLDLDPDLFEVIPAEARRAIMNRLAAARRARPRRWAISGLAAAAVVLAAGSWFMIDRVPTPVQSPLLNAMVDDHIRYLRHPDRQASADIEAVTEHLATYVDFPVELPAPPDATFAGARGCLLQGRRATLAFYDTVAGPASYFIIPDESTDLAGRPCAGDRRLTCSVRAGYHVVHWHHAGLLHALVGNEPAALLSLARACGGRGSMEEPS